VLLYLQVIIQNTQLLVFLQILKNQSQTRLRKQCDSFTHATEAGYTASNMVTYVVCNMDSVHIAYITTEETILHACAVFYTVTSYSEFCNALIPP